MQDQGHERSGSGEEEHGTARGLGLPVGGLCWKRFETEVLGRERVVEGAGDGELQRKKVRGSTLYSPTSMMTAIGGLEGTKFPESLFKVTQTKHSHTPQLLCSGMGNSLPTGIMTREVQSDQFE